MRWGWLAIGTALAAPAATAGEPPAPSIAVRDAGFGHAGRDGSGGELEREVLAEINRVRADPAGYAETLRRYRRYFHANLVTLPGSGEDLATEEGLAPVDEAIRFLRQQAPAQPYASSALLGRAAQDHGAEQAVDGDVGHLGIDGSDPGDRVARRGGGRYVAEVITYGSRTAADVVRQLIVDDGVPDRGHRRILFAPEFRFAGVGCAPHPEYRETCVVDIARTPDARSRWAPVQIASVD